MNNTINELQAALTVLPELEAHIKEQIESEDNPSATRKIDHLPKPKRRAFKHLVSTIAYHARHNIRRHNEGDQEDSTTLNQE